MMSVPVEGFEGLAQVWLPSSPTHRVTAVVKFDPEIGCTARMLGGPAEPSSGSIPVDDGPSVITINGFDAFVDFLLRDQPREFPELHGRVDDRRFVMLGCELTLVSSPAGDVPPVVEVTAETALLDLPDAITELEFDVLSLSAPWLTDLVANSGLTSRLTWDHEQESLQRLEGSAERVTAFEGTIEHADGPVSASLQLHHTQASARRPRIVTLTEEADLELRFPKPMPVLRLRDYWLPALEDLITLAVAHRDVADEVWLRWTGTAGSSDADTSQVARLVTRRRHAPEPLDERFIPGVHGRFQVGDVALGDLLTRWFRLYETDGPSIRLLLAATDRRNISLRTHVMTLAVAAEWWHRERFKQDHTDPVSHQARVERIVAAAGSAGIAPEELAWLRRRLDGNSKSQLDRLLDTARSVPDMTRDLLGDPSAFGDQGPGLAHRWAKWVAKARNTGAAHPGGGADYTGIFWAAESLRWMLTAALLVELGIGDVAGRIGLDPSYRTCREHVQLVMRTAANGAER